MSYITNAIAIDDSFDKFLSSFASTGIPVDEVKAHIRHKLAVEQALADVAARVKADFEYLASDAGKALQEAYELFHNKAARADTAGYDKAYSELGQKWLFLRHGVKVGDTIEIHSWTKPRVIKLTNVVLLFDRDESALRGFVEYQGVPLQNVKNKKSAHVSGLDDFVRKLNKTDPNEDSGEPEAVPA